MERILNFRLLANGMKNNQQKELKNIYRSAALNHATADDIQNLKDLNITNVIDLRSKNELKTAPMFNQPGIVSKNILIIDDDKQNQSNTMIKRDFGKFMDELYANIFVHTDGFKDELKYILILEGKPFLFHCTAGKDRTGITGVILMHILGFTREQITEEYLRFDERLKIALLQKIKQEHSEELKNVPEEKLIKVVTIIPEYIEAFLSGIERVYGSMDNYIAEKLELSLTEQEQLRKWYLD